MSVETEVLKRASRKIMILILIMLIPTAYTFGAELYSDSSDNVDLNMILGLCVGIIIALWIIAIWMQELHEKADEEKEAIEFLVNRGWTVLDREEIDDLTKSLQDYDPRNYILCPRVESKECMAGENCPKDTDEIRYICPQELADNNQGLSIA